MVDWWLVSQPTNLPPRSRKERRPVVTVLMGLALGALGLVIGFIIAFASGAGRSMNLFIGLLLVVAGAVVGFVIEWLIDSCDTPRR